MSCQYRSDFGAVSGSYLAVQGWGGEDGALYQRYLSRYRVVRAFDPDLRHVYHGKQCDTSLPVTQYRTCLMSKIANEGSQSQLGLLALAHAGELGPRAYSLFRLPWFERPAVWAAIVLVVLLAASVVLNLYLYCHSRQPVCERVAPPKPY